MLQRGTPYMVRKDGEILECGKAHPYILYSCFDAFNVSFNTILDNFPYSYKWFYDNTENQWVRDKIIECFQLLKDIISNNTRFNLFRELGVVEDKANKAFEDLNIKETNKLEITSNILETFKALMQDLNDECNQEFLRFRIGDRFYGWKDDGAYFRVSSIDFNWFPIIWKIIYENKWLEDITIETDVQSGKTFTSYFYNIGGTKIDKLPREEFINLKGNTIIESSNNKLSKGFTLKEALGDFGPFHNHAKYMTLKNFYIDSNFIKGE